MHLVINILHMCGKLDLMAEKKQGTPLATVNGLCPQSVVDTGIECSSLESYSVITPKFAMAYRPCQICIKLHNTVIFASDYHYFGYNDYHKHAACHLYTKSPGY